MLNRRKKFLKRGAPRFVQIEKPHTKARNKLIFVEVLLVLVVLVGIAYGVVRVTKVSLPNIIHNAFSDVIPKSPIANRKEVVESKATQIIKSLPAGLFSLKKELSRTDDKLVISSKEGVTAVFSLKKDAASQLTTLQNLLTKAKINKRKIEKIDFRFDKLVVVYKK
ncbi:MAG: hypothetical protein WD231_01870 [Candidatus Woykebacteria bacterium]